VVCVSGLVMPDRFNYVAPQPRIRVYVYELKCVLIFKYVCFELWQQVGIYISAQQHGISGKVSLSSLHCVRKGAHKLTGYKAEFCDRWNAVSLDDYRIP
jgi:hypothetical protein